MASLAAAIQQVRRTRDRVDGPPSRHFDRYRPEYERVLEATAALGGEAAFDEVREWMVETTVRRRRLPTPHEVRTRAREVCVSRGVDVPESSALRDT